MILLDTDILTLLTSGHPRVVERVGAAVEIVATTVITRIEILQGRFAFVLKASNGDELQRAQQRLLQAEQALSRLAVLPVDTATAGDFDRLRQNSKLRKIGRADLLIASIALALDATVVTRNVRHFRQVPRLKVENWVD